MEIFEKDIEEHVLRSICMQVLDVYTRSYGMVVPKMPFSSSRDALLHDINFSSVPNDADLDGSVDESLAVTTTVKTIKSDVASSAEGVDGTDEHKDSSSRLFTDHYHLHYPDNRKHDHASSSSSSSSSSSWMRPPLPQSAFAPTTSSSYPPPDHDEAADEDCNHTNSHSDGDDTPYDMPPPSDTPSTMGTSTPSFDDLVLPRGNMSVHGASVSLELGSKYYELQQCQLGKRTRDE